MFRWAIEGALVGGPRPRVRNKPWSQVSRSIVDEWVKKAKVNGIRSVICLLDESQLRLYEKLPRGLVPYYRASGLRAEHIPVRNYQHPALSDRQLQRVWKAYKRLEKPVLIHCSAGIGRTGKAVSFIQAKFKKLIPAQCVHSQVTRRLLPRLGPCTVQTRGCYSFERLQTGPPSLDSRLDLSRS